MGIADWASLHWIDLLQSVGIIGGLLFTAWSFREDSNNRKVQNVFALTAAHRDIWSNLYNHPHLARVLEETPDMTELSDEEELFVHSLILHLEASFLARKFGMNLHEEGLRRDIKEFFSLPIPRAVWHKSKAYQNSEFVEFVETAFLMS